jgi:YD repeat-containing protein
MNNGVATIKFGDGRDEFYIEQTDGNFEPQPGVHNIFARKTDGTFTLTDTGQTVRHWDAAGRLTSIVDKNGNTISLTSQDNLLVTVTDPVGREVHFTYDAEGRITQLEYPLGRTVCYVYDENGDLVSSFDPMDQETT